MLTSTADFAEFLAMMQANNTELQKASSFFRDRSTLGVSAQGSLS